MITVFTPTHVYNPKYLLELYSSLKRQTNKNFEWIVLVNNKALNNLREIEELFTDDWVKIYTSTVVGVGALKHESCMLGSGEIFLELDHDDYLEETAIEEVYNAFSDPEVMFVYSNVFRFDDATKTSALRFRSDCGWKYRKGTQYEEAIAFPASAQYLRRIEWAPDHLRAFRKSAYEKINGYNPSLQVGDDHDLICRLYIEYGEKGFKHIDKGLYYYRITGNNTSSASQRNADIQVQVDKNYVNHAEKMYLKWAKDNDLLCLDLGGRFNSPNGYASVDLLDADIIMDLTKPWQLEDNSVGVLRAYHLLEHLDDSIHFFNEAYRVLAPGGFLLIEVPSVSGEGAFSDPTHVKFFNLRSFDYYTTKLSDFIRPQYSGKFQKARVVEYWWDKKVSVISAQLICFKGWYEQNWCGIKEL